MPKGIYERKPRQPKRYPEALVSEVRRLYCGGLTQCEVAAALKTTQKVVYTVMLHHGIKSRPAVQRTPTRAAASPHWKGDRAGYTAFHARLYALKGAPRLCSICRTSAVGRRYDWANLTGRYDDPEDYARMCRQCHRRYDNSRRGRVANQRADITAAVVVPLRAAGLSINEIARRLGTSWPTVRKCLP